jgi:hypothetical protein
MKMNNITNIIWIIDGFLIVIGLIFLFLAKIQTSPEKVPIHPVKILPGTWTLSDYATPTPTPTPHPMRTLTIPSADYVCFPEPIPSPRPFLRPVDAPVGSFLTYSQPAETLSDEWVVWIDDAGRLGSFRLPKNYQIVKHKP